MTLAEMNRKLAENEMLIQQLIAKSRMADRADTSVADFDAIQAKADAALTPHGRRAGPPLLGEPPMAYRRRMAGQLKAFAPTWADMPLEGVNDAAFERLEVSLYADAASAPPTAEPGTLRCIPRPSYGGHKICEYVGSPSAWMDQFAGPVRQFVSKFLTREAA